MKRINSLFPDSPIELISSKTLIMARWVAITGQLAAVLVTHYILSVPLPLEACLLTILVAVLLNLYAAMRERSSGISALKASFYLGFDLLQLSLLLFLTGGLGNPFFMLLLGPVVIGSTLLARWQMISLIITGIISVILLAHFFVPLQVPVTIDHAPHSLILMGQFIAFSITAFFVSFFGWRASSENRAMQKAHEAVKAVITQKRHLNSLGAQAAAAAHELGSPLSTIAVAAGELANEAGKASALSEDIQLIISQVERCKRILQKFGEQPDEETSEYILAPLPLTRLIHEIAENFGHENPGITIEIEDFLNNPVIISQKPEIVHSLGVYIQNAIQRAESRVMLSCSENKDMVLIQIRDDGPGFGVDIMSSLGQPLKTFRPDGYGSKRLGIFIAQNLLEELGARTVYSNDLQTGGAIVAIHWPKDKIK